MEKDNSLTNKAYETIRQQIFDFDLFPGQNRIRLSSQQGAEYEPYPHQTGTHAP
mgnify:CR=1 FL=1